jgi:hypothetical protein
MMLKFGFGKIKVAKGLQITSRVLYSTYNVLELAHQKNMRFVAFSFSWRLNQNMSQSCAAFEYGP